jgi:voltage-gated sodium channel
MKEKIQKLTENSKFQNFIIVLIIINAIILGLETSSELKEKYGNVFYIADWVILKIFITEIVLKIYAQRVNFFTKPWNMFDFIVIIIALAPVSQAFSSLRALRVLRVLRLVSSISAMRKVIEGLFSAIPGIISVSSIMSIFFYIFAVIGTHLYGEQFPEWFGSLGKTMFTLFQVMTLESWSMGIVRPVMDVYPSAWAFFILYILVTTFTMLNLFIAIIVNAMSSGSDEVAQENRLEVKDIIIKEIKDSEKRIMDRINTNSNSIK